MQELERTDGVSERAAAMLEEVIGSASSVVPDEARDALAVVLERARAVLESRLRQYLEQSPARVASAYEIALACGWAVMARRFDAWYFDPEATVSELVADFEYASRLHLEQITSAVYETSDGAWELARIYYRGSIDAVGKLFVNCLTPTTSFPGYRYYQASRERQGAEHAGRPELELYVLRPKGHRDGLDALAAPPEAPKLLFSYFPALGCIDEIEKPTKLRRQEFLHPADADLRAALFEIIRASRDGLIPRLRVDAVNPHSLASFLPDSCTIDSDGAVSPLPQQPPESVIAGGTFAIDRTMPPPEVARIAREYPIVLDMTEATAAQKACITEVCGTLLDKSDDVLEYPRLEMVRMSFFVAHAATARAPLLRTIGLRFWTGAVTVVEMPSLTSCHAAYVRFDTACIWQLDESFRVIRLQR